MIFAGSATVPFEVRLNIASRPGVFGFLAPETIKKKLFSSSRNVEATTVGRPFESECVEKQYCAMCRPMLAISYCEKNPVRPKVLALLVSSIKK